MTFESTTPSCSDAFGVIYFCGNKMAFGGGFLSIETLSVYLRIVGRLDFDL